jgi:hypothetical protein
MESKRILCPHCDWIGEYQLEFWGVLGEQVTLVCVACGMAFLYEYGDDWVMLELPSKESDVN